ncbi:MAG: hypothetical protein JNN31_10460 [Dechloromonas sp.]|nr:hypothetical protein [Dechloromonas sp.]
MIGDPHADKPGLGRLHAAAARAGMTAKALETACVSMAIPVTCIRISPRCAYVSLSEFDAWLTSLKGSDK